MPTRQRLAILILIVTEICGLSTSSIAADSGKSFGMAGAFVALTDDISAQFYNPAGLSQIKKRTVGLSLRNSFSKLALSEKELFSSTTYSYFNPLETLGLIWPLGKVVLAIGSDNNYFRLSSSDVVTTTTSFTYKYDEKLYTPSLAIGLEIIPGLSLGFNLSYLFKNSVLNSVLNDVFGCSTTNSSFNGSGIEVVSGLLYKPFSLLSLGAAIKHIGDVNVSSTWKTTWKITSPDDSGNENITLSFTEKYPFISSLSIALKPLKNLTFALQSDLVSSQDYELLIVYDTEPFSGMGSRPFQGHVKTNPITAVHTGVEYLISVGKSGIPLRAGYFTRPSNADEFSSLSGLQLVFNTSTIAVGTGYNAENFGIDIGAQFVTMIKSSSGGYEEIRLTDTKLLVSSFLKF